MEYEKQQQLKAAFPKLFSHLPFGFECGDGWFKLIYSLASNIVDVIEANDLDISCSQVKEKYGGLRFYMSSSTDAIESLIEKAEELSFRTCEICGEEGKLNRGPWYEVRCDDHAKPLLGNSQAGKAANC